MFFSLSSHPKNAVEITLPETPFLRRIPKSTSHPPSFVCLHASGPHEPLGLEVACLRNSAGKTTKERFGRRNRSFRGESETKPDVGIPTGLLIRVHQRKRLVDGRIRRRERRAADDEGLFEVGRG